MALAEARRKKEDTYPEFLVPGRCRLVVLALETGGRWSLDSARALARAKAQQSLRTLARAKAQQSPRPLRASQELAYFRRWTRLLAVATQRSYAATLVTEPGEWDSVDLPQAPPPAPADLALEVRYDPLDARGLRSLAPTAE